MGVQPVVSGYGGGAADAGHRRYGGMVPGRLGDARGGAFSNAAGLRRKTGAGIDRHFRRAGRAGCSRAYRLWEKCVGFSCRAAGQRPLLWDPPAAWRRLDNAGHGACDHGGDESAAGGTSGRGQALFCLLAPHMEEPKATRAVLVVSVVTILPLAAAGFYVLLHSGYNFTLLAVSVYLVLLLLLKKK